MSTLLSLSKSKIAEHGERFIDYLMGHYELDGIWENSLGFDAGPCYCEKCRAAYFDDTGKDIPRLPGGPGDIAALDSPGFAEYRQWKARSVDRHIERMRRAVKKYGEDKAYCAEIFDLYSDEFSKTTGIDHGNAKKSFDFIVSCVFLNKNHAGEGGKAWDTIYNAASTIRFSRALDPKKQPVIVTGGNGTRWRYVMDPPLESRLWMWQIASVGGGIWNCYFNGQDPGRTCDRRGAYGEKEIYTYLADNSAMISDSVPAADAAIYYSNPTRDRFCRLDETRDDYGVYIKGAERVLLENHIQYGFIPDSELSLERLEGVKVLLLPNTALISDKDMELIRTYVRNGGGLIASRNTSLFDETGKPRRDFGLGDLLGVSYTGRLLDTANDTYQLIRDKQSPVLKDIGDTDMLINGGSTVLCVLADQNYRIAATHIPMIPNQPPEYAWIPNMETDYPTIVSGAYGKGRVVYFANAIEALCYLNGHEDYTEVYKNALDFASRGGYMLQAGAPRSVHINVIKAQNNPNHIIVALVNTTGASQRPLKEVAPVPVEIAIPLEDRTLRWSKVLRGGAITIHPEPGALHISIPALQEFAAVELELV